MTEQATEQATNWQQTGITGVYVMPGVNRDHSLYGWEEFAQEMNSCLGAAFDQRMLKKLIWTLWNRPGSTYNRSEYSIHRLYLPNRAEMEAVKKRLHQEHYATLLLDGFIEKQDGTRQLDIGLYITVRYNDPRDPEKRERERLEIGISWHS